MNASHLSDAFASAPDYASYVAAGTSEQQRRWNEFHAAVRVTDAQRATLSGFTRDMKILVISGIWCGDCVQQCPLLEQLAQQNPARIALRFVERDAHRDPIERFRINGGDRVPVALFMAEDFELCSIYGDRTLHRYRALARKQLGAACPTGIAGPDPDEVASTLADWADEFERVQLMLRLSARLRQVHGQ